MRRAGLIATGICTLALLLPAAAPAAVGDVYVVDDGSGDMTKVAPGGGPPTLFSDDLELPWGMVMAPDRSLLVADYGTGSSIQRVLPSGATTEFFSDPSQTGIDDLAWGPDGNLYVLDYLEHNIFRLNPETLAFNEVANDTGVPDWDSGYSIIVARDLTIYFTDSGDEIFKVSPGGPVTKLYEGPLLAGADGLELSPDERWLYVGSETSNQILKVNRSTGDASIFADGLSDVTGLARFRDGGFLAGDGNVNDLISRVNRTGSAVSVFSDGPAYGYPHDIVIEPPPCGGKVPTVVGTDRRDVIRGTAFADIILTLGGKDVVRGLAGNDIVCGGAAKDKLIGGKGKDRLLGGAGRDRLIGGAGKDKLRGGPGRDFQRQ